MSVRKKIEDIVFASLLFLFFAVVLININRWIGAFQRGNSFDIGPKAYPIVLGVAALFLLSIQLIKQIVDYRETKKEQNIVAVEPDEPLSSLYVLFAMLPVIFMFIIFMKYIGFLFCGVILLILLQLIMGNRTWYKIALFTIVVILACYIIFVKLLYIELPRGVGIFEDLSYLIY